MAGASPKVVVLAGPNGAGKSTSAAKVLRGALKAEEFVNADTIAQGLSAASPDRVAFRAGRRIMLKRLAERPFASRKQAGRRLQKTKMRSQRSFLPLAALGLATILSSAAPAADLKTPDAYQGPLARLEASVHEELARGILSGVSIALVDDDRIVYARGFGLADTERRIAATPATVYRAGSISKLFTAVAAMGLVEEGKLDLDAPLAKHNPEFRICNPFEGAPPITLRQLMCHRSGMVREAPVGGYFDDRQATLDATLASLADCVLANPPNTKTRYSNVGPSIVGQTIAKVSGEQFDALVQRRVFDVVGMSSSSWSLRPSLVERMAGGYMRVAQADGGFKRIRAPRFELGTMPAGNLYTTVEDLGRFVTFLLGDGRRGDRILLKPETLAEMFRPQLTSDATGFGLGFSVGKFREFMAVQHMGAVYGFTSSLVAIPSQGVGAVVLANEDIAIGSVQRLMAAALGAALEGRAGEKPPQEPPAKFELAELEPFIGKYESESYWAEFSLRDGQLRAVVSGQPMTLAPTGELSFRANGRFVNDAPFVFERGADGGIAACAAMRQEFQRVDDAKLPAAPENWRRFVGSYGPPFIPLIVSIRHGHLYAMTENEMDYRLTPLNRTVFRLPRGLYDDEQLVFQLDADGNAHSVVLANVALKRVAP